MWDSAEVWLLGKCILGLHERVFGWTKLTRWALDMKYVVLESEIQACLSVKGCKQTTILVKS